MGIQVVDDAGSGTPDTFDAVPFGDPNDCSAIAPGTFLSIVLSGDIAVVYAPGGSPTGTAQCRNGGWGNLSQFQNQLQCILFVARKFGERGRFEAKPPQCPAHLPD